MMRYGSRKAVVLLGIILVIALSAGTTGAGQGALTPMPLEIPANFPRPVYDLASNPITREGFELGRRLFYDPILSRDGSISCATCHIQGSAFTHHGHDVSHGIDDELGFRNAPPVMNLAWTRFFFWDGGVFDLDLQPIAPIENPVEMGEQMPRVIGKLKKDKKYPYLFQEVFGPGEITSSNMLKALSQFMLQCVSSQSKYDKIVRGEGESFTQEEQEGFAIFKARCASCHSTDLFTDNQFHNNGLPVDLYNDSGRYRVTLNEADWYVFKTPSLRNVMKTAPYMHDGRFYTINAVYEHYDKGIKASPTLDSLLRKDGVLGIPLSADERGKLTAFLHTLTDENFIRNPLFAEQIKSKQ